ncbi:hypothetical protein [Scytonema sp. HK-05]|uniref:hypothetical protein n=1 Tax=Scytonema sp. HK-05 TaxID=1137095 RepID=UPI00116144BC|nr:hypothetical protein [Scytonema sp. HK-05]
MLAFGYLGRTDEARILVPLGRGVSSRRIFRVPVLMSFSRFEKSDRLLEWCTLRDRTLTDKRAIAFHLLTKSLDSGL